MSRLSVTILITVSLALLAQAGEKEDRQQAFARLAKTHALADKQVLKLIPAAELTDDRDEFIRNYFGGRSLRNIRVYELVCLWDKGLEPSSLGQGHSLAGLLQELGLRPYEYQGTEDVLFLKLPGDWVIRKDASIDAKMTALVEIMNQNVSPPIQVERKEIDVDGLVATGACVAEGRVRLYYRQPDRVLSPQNRAGSLQEFLHRLADAGAMPLVNQTKASREKVLWAEDESFLDVVAQHDKEKLDEVLKLVSERTGIQFSREKQKLPIWVFSQARKEQ